MASKQNCVQNTTELFSNGCTSGTEFLNHGRLNFEEERIKSFSSWPVHFPVDPNRLAKAGFYYTGNGDEVVCFSCEGHVQNWNYGDIVLKKHADLFPNCNFIKNISNNVPLLKVPKSKTQPFTVKDGANVNNNCSHLNPVDYNKLKSEVERLKTFNGKWPLTFISASSLAHAGFFYMGVDNKVQCPYCKGIISDWVVDSNPFEEHLKKFPWCDFLVENISQIKGKTPWFQSSSQDVCGTAKIRNNSSISDAVPDSKPSSESLIHTNLEELGVHLHKDPFHPRKASFTSRIQSFQTWPFDAPVLKEDLAAAGFFYTGVSDRTICFHCNGGLCTWEKGDDPWIEHARWFPACDFLRLNKGSDFIKLCSATSLTKKLRGNKRTLSTEPVTKEPLLMKVDEAMESNLVKYVLETELFPSYIVRAAILFQIKQTGNTFTSIDDLCVAASSLKDRMESESIDVRTLQAEDLNINEIFSQSCNTSDAPSREVNDTATPLNVQQSTSEKKSQENSLTEKQLEEDDLNEQCICKICMDKEVGVVFLPCGHLPACTVCAPALKFCPMCRKSIQATVRVYLN